MALAERTDRLAPVLEAAARAIGRHGIKTGAAEGAKAALRVELETDVRRTVRVYWTGFDANVPGRSIGLHLEVAEPRVHWTECYLSLDHRNWVFTFHERPDGEVQLAYYRDYASPYEAIEGFFNISGWYVLTATDLTWSDVVYDVSDEIDWPEHNKTLAGDATSAAIQESLKKSTIMWLKWDGAGGPTTMPVWYVYDQKATKIYILSGERQQMIPDARSLTNVTAILRWKGKNSSVAEIPAWVSPIEPDDPRWSEVADKVAEKRLNIPGLPEDTAKRWAEDCVILELTLRT